MSTALVPYSQLRYSSTGPRDIDLVDLRMALILDPSTPSGFRWANNYPAHPTLWGKSAGYNTGNRKGRQIGYSRHKYCPKHLFYFYTRGHWPLAEVRTITPPTREPKRFKGERDFLAIVGEPTPPPPPRYQPPPLSADLEALLDRMVW